MASTMAIARSRQLRFQLGPPRVKPIHRGLRCVQLRVALLQGKSVAGDSRILRPFLRFAQTLLGLEERCLHLIELALLEVGEALGLLRGGAPASGAAPRR